MVVYGIIINREGSTYYTLGMNKINMENYCFMDQTYALLFLFSGALVLLSRIYCIYDANFKKGQGF
jgi:hypothetical protein